MKKAIPFLSLVCLVTALTACGKKDEPVAATTSTVAAANACATGQVYSPQYGCAPAQYGQPNGYNGGQNWQPINNAQWPSGGCQSGYYQYPYGGGYGSYGGGCQRQRSYTVYYYGGYYYYF